VTAVVERRATRTIADLPGPRGLPGAGNALQLPNTRLHLALERWARRHGPVFRFTIGSRPIVAFAESDAINAILRERPDGYRRWREAEDVFRELGIHGVFSAEGGEWRKQRRLAVMALNTNHLHRYFDVIRVSTQRLRGRLERAAAAGEPFELQRAFMSFTTDVASWLAFGHDLNTLERESELQSHIERVFPMLSRRIAAPFPYWRYVKPPGDRAAERSLVEIRAAVDGFVAQARERMARRPELYEQPENFLESMLAAQREGRYSDEEVFGNTFQILLAGEDTTAHSLTWTAWFIARDRALQRRLAEAAPVIEDPDSRFEYGDAVLRETMRLKSVAPLLFVEPLQDVTIAGVELPRGTRVTALTRYAGAHGDATFDPERRRDPKRFLTFGAGPRFCPGRNLALLEARSALAMLARGFEIALDPREPPVRERFGFTMQPTGLRVLVRARQR
jgi:cytochrome P450